MAYFQISSAMVTNELNCEVSDSFLFERNLVSQLCVSNNSLKFQLRKHDLQLVNCYRHLFTAAILIFIQLRNMRGQTPAHMLLQQGDRLHVIDIFDRISSSNAILVLSEKSIYIYSMPSEICLTKQLPLQLCSNTIANMLLNFQRRFNENVIY